MSLKAFHLFFIGWSVILAAFVAAWATNQYRAVGDAESVVTALGALMAGGGLIVYGVKFQRKVRGL
jgi:hypothetical protein